MNTTLMEKSPKDLVPLFFEKTAKTYDTVVKWTTLGNDKYWKEQILKKIPPCSSILDLACGTGILTFQICEKFPHAKIIGVDITKSYLREARKKLNPHHKISLLNQDAEKLILKDKFDCITSSYISKYCEAEVLIKTCLDHLKPGGKIILHDFTYPQNRLVRAAWGFYFFLLRFSGYFLTSWKEVFVELPKLIRSTNWSYEYELTLKKYGFKVERESLSMGTSTILTGTHIV